VIWFVGELTSPRLDQSVIWPVRELVCPRINWLPSRPLNMAPLKQNNQSFWPSMSPVGSGVARCGPAQLIDRQDDFR